MPGLEDLYREIILDHYRAPRNRGELPVPPAQKYEGFNPLCGDEVVLWLEVEDGTVVDVRTEGQGCSISQASTSMMSAAIKGKPVDEVRRLIRAFKSLMSLANERTGAQESEIGRHAADAAQRRGYAGGFEDSAASAQADRMSALATAGFEGAAQVRQEESDHYGKAIGAFAQLQDSYNQAKSAGDIAYARDLTQTHISQAEANLHALDLNSQQGLAYAGAVNDAKRLQAQLDADFNKDLIDNNRYIQGQQQIAAQLMLQRESIAAQERAQDKTLAARKREFDIDQGFKEKQFGEQKREFDVGLKANPNTAYRALPGQSFRNIPA